ncbi:MAG: hypothetical protein RIS35_3749 [Pseudomonadota bacterium]
MARRNLFAIKVDATAVNELAQRLGEISSESLGERLVDTVNEVAKSAYELSRDTITADMNLTDSYIRRRMELREATKARPTAEIIASGARVDITGLGHYGALQLSKTARWSESDGAERGIAVGPWPLWEPRRGDPARRIGPGEKAAGIRVEVRRGNAKPIRRAFTIPGIVHTSDGSPVVFEGTGAPGRLKEGEKRKTPRQGVQALYGPSVYQLFRVAAGRIEDRVSGELRDAVLEEASRTFEDLMR